MKTRVYQWMLWCLPPSACANLGPLHTRDWEPMTITLQALSLVDKAEPLQVRFTLCLRDQGSMWMQDGCKVYMDSYMASNGSCFTVTWIVFNNHLLDVGLTQHWEITTLGTLATVDLFYTLICEVPHEETFIQSAFGWDRSHMTSHYTWGLVTTLHDVGGVLGQPLGTFLWGSHNFMVTALGSCVKWEWTMLRDHCILCWRKKRGGFDLI